MQEAESDQADSPQSTGKRYFRLSSVFVAFVVLFSITAILGITVGVLHTHQNTTYLCETCGIRRSMSEHYVLWLRYYAAQRNVSKTLHTEIFEKSGLECDEHQWRRHFTNSQGFLGNYDSPIGGYGDYGFMKITDAEKAKILSEVASCATEDERIRCILRYKQAGWRERPDEDE